MINTELSPFIQFGATSEERVERALELSQETLSRLKSKT